MTEDIYDKYDYTDQDRFVMGLVGEPLYVSIRNRLTCLDVPAQMVNAVIVEAIVVHDDGMKKNGVGFSEIVVKNDGDRVEVWVDEL